MIADVNTRLRKAYAAHEDATIAVKPLTIEEEVVRGRIADAERLVDAAQAQVATAAKRVVVAESEPVARAALERLEEAFTTILEFGPDVLALTHKDLLPPDLAHDVRGVAESLLLKALG